MSRPSSRMFRPSVLSHVKEGAYDDTTSHRRDVRVWMVTRNLEIRLPTPLIKELRDAGYIYAHIIRALEMLEEGADFIAATVPLNPARLYSHELVMEWRVDRQWVYDCIYCPFWEKYEDVKDVWDTEQRRGTLPRATIEFNDFLKSKTPLWDSVEKRMRELRELCPQDLLK
ncbi:hypothetical protein L228DRAFT_269041 [Xylona heveae TC161]|uniref:Uncharacterized protein n=1 Tax=Xylona heveae (strain CBS 132557 / TC161) TaxID=1328760 RepID=A0A165FZM9_XYLHT|nr:hypothetical protein L228DRAFT_269041 [Xylona heveae TC161]KZF21571.1 hypothetical protein L228DRAFT_269041 [Xylona heveae TC161]